MKIFSHGILGMNARNLKYILSKNSRESISLADSKMRTKSFLSSRGIPFAKTFAVLRNPQEVKEFSFSSIPTNNFVIKPNRGSQGNGILIVTGRDNKRFIQDEEWSEDEFLLHMTDIAHGSYSLQGSSDSVIIEELLTPGRDFREYCKYGLADIRIIVFNYVPITAMIRMPTESSGGKANLAQGGVGLGLNIADGKIVSLFQNRKIYTTIFPSEYSRLQNGKLPFWDEILLLSSQVQMYTKLGYLALDWVITEDGPKLLEINARAGLEIQNVNIIPLASRLKKIEDLKILTPEKGVEIAKTLFHSDIVSPLGGKKILGREQMGTIQGKNIRVLVDMSTPFSSVSEDIFALHGPEFPLSLMIDSGVRMTLESCEKSSSTSSTVILGRNALKDFLIDPNLHFSPDYIGKSKNGDTKLQEFDEAVYEVGKKVNLSSLLSPVNYFSELDMFIKNSGVYNPIFEYHFPENERIEKTRDTLKKLTNEAESFRSLGYRIAPLYEEKLEEIGGKLSLLEAYKKEDFQSITKYNDILFGKTCPSFLDLAKEKLPLHSSQNTRIDALLGRILSLEEVVNKINEYFESKGIHKIPITLEGDNLSRISVAYGRQIKIKVSKNAIIREHEVGAILAHEIGTHLTRYLSGKKTGLKLFQYGTGNYLADEEGLAVYQSFSHLPEGYEKNGMYLKYYLLSLADTLSFSKTVELLVSLHPDKPLESIFAGAVRLKRGIIHTERDGTPGTTYAKDKIYLDGFMRVSEWISKGGISEELFYGKIKISDLEIIRCL